MKNFPSNFTRRWILDSFDATTGYFIRPFVPLEPICESERPDPSRETLRDPVSRLRERVYNHVVDVLKNAAGQIIYTQYIDLGPMDRDRDAIDAVIAELRVLRWDADLKISNKGKDFYVVLHERILPEGWP